MHVVRTSSLRLRLMQAATLAVAAVVATGCSGGGSTSSSPPSRTPGASATGASASVASPQVFSEVPNTGGAPAALAPGTVSSPEGFEPALTFDVPDGWYGGGDVGGFGIGQGLNEAEQRFAGGGIQVEVLQMPVDEAAQRFAKVKGIDAGKPTTAEVDGRPATVFSGHPTDGAVGLDALGTSADVNEFSEQQIFVDLRDQTLLIRTEVSEPTADDEIASVLQSLRFAE